MAELPFDRLREEPPFTYCGVDLFGPFVICSKQKELKRYGVMFTCLCSRAIHIEVAHSLDKDSFLLALSRFIERRGNIRQMRPDNGSNYVVAVKKLRNSFKDINHSKINEYLQMHGAYWITWINNSPTASHMGGVWERQIRTARGILNVLVKILGKSLADTSLHTFLVDVEAIVNARPITIATISDVKSDIPFSPAHLLTMISKVILPSLDAFHQLICTIESAAEEFNILQMNFGRDGAKSSCEHCKREKLAKLEEETFETETLHCCKPELIEIIGR